VLVAGVEELDAAHEEGRPMLVREVMTATVVTVSPEASVKRATELLDEHSVTALPVVDDQGRLVGVVSEADVLRESLLPDRRRHEIPAHVAGRTVPLLVRDVMSTLPMTIEADADLAEAAELLVDTQVKSLPVVEHDRVVGVVSRRDMIAVLARRDPLIEAEVDDLLRAADVECVVDVVDGVVRLDGPDDNRTREIARVLAATVPGVVGVAFGS
jgi:CBS-domain-containing membrane protein